MVPFHAFSVGGVYRCCRINLPGVLIAELFSVHMIGDNVHVQERGSEYTIRTRTKREPCARIVRSNFFLRVQVARLSSVRLGVATGL